MLNITNIEVKNKKFTFTFENGAIVEAEENRNTSKDKWKYAFIAGHVELNNKIRFYTQLPKKYLEPIVLFLSDMDED